MAAAGVEQRNQKQLKLLALLREREGQTVGLEDVCRATGWKPLTAKTYLAKKLLGDVLARQDDGTFLVRGAAGLTDAEFTRLLSQSRERQQFGHQFTPLVRQLLERSRINVSLAVETFNRATLENRLDAFVLLFITGWEQLLKAELEDKKLGSIFTGERGSSGREKTIGFQQCLDLLLPAKDVVRRNLEVVRSLRDDAAHLLVLEVQPVATRYFQAGLINYVERFHAFTGENPLTLAGAGLLTLALPYQRPDIVTLRTKYGEATAAEIAAFVVNLERDTYGEADPRLAIDLQYRLTLSKDGGASSIHLTKGSDVGSIPGMIVEKPTSAEKTHPLYESELIAELTKRTGRPWSTTDVRAAIFKEGVKKANNEFHFHFEKVKRHGYSMAFADHVVRKVSEDPGYLDRARQSYLFDMRKARRSNSR